MHNTKKSTIHQSVEIAMGMANLSMVMSFKRSNCCKVVFDQLRLSINASYAVLMCRIDVKHQYNIRAVCAYAHNFKNILGVRFLQHVH